MYILRKQTEDIKGRLLVQNIFDIELHFIKPKAPIFKSTAAKITDPCVVAST